MIIGAYPDGAGDNGADSPARPARSERRSNEPSRSQSVAVRQGRASIEAVLGSSVKQKADTDNTINSGGKVTRPIRFPRGSRIQRSDTQRESPGLFRSCISVVKGLVDSPPEIAEAQCEQTKAELARMVFKVGVLKHDLQRREQQLQSQEKRHEKYRKDAEAGLRHNRGVHDREYRALVNQQNAEMVRLRDGNQQALATQQRQHESLLHRAKQEVARTIEAPDAAATNARNEICGLRKTCRDYEERLNAQEATISRMQSARFQAIEASHWAPLETSEIEGSLSSIQTRVRKWSSDHAMCTLDHFVDPEGFSHSINEVTKRGCVLEAESLHERLLLNKSMRKPGKAAAVLLGAAVMHDIMFGIIADPFFAFRGERDEALLGVEHAAVLSTLFEHIGGCDQAGAAGLRCQLLRLLDPPIKEDMNDAVGHVKNIAQKSRSRAVVALTKVIIDGLLGPLTEQEQHKAFEGLSGIVDEAAMLSWALWTRKTVICALSLSHFQSGAKGQFSYDSASDVLEPHSMHNLLLEDEPRALDGGKIVLVCSPALKMFGNAEGRDYDQSKVLKKAIVWMG